MFVLPVIHLILQISLPTSFQLTCVQTYIGAEICHWQLVFLSGDVGVLTFYSAQSASVQAYFMLVHYF